MRIYVCHSCGYDYKSELYNPLKESELGKKHSLFLPHEGNNGEINTTNIIKKSDLIIAEISHTSTGVGIELGRAEIFNKKILCLYKKGAEYSKAVHFVSNNFIEYKNKKDMIIKIKPTEDNNKFKFIKIVVKTKDNEYFDLKSCVVGSELTRQKNNLPDVGNGMFAEITLVPKPK